MASRATIDYSVRGDFSEACQWIPICWKSALIGYAIYPHGTNGFSYSKTTDGGSTWNTTENFYLVDGTDYTHGISVYPEWYTPTRGSSNYIWVTWQSDNGDHIKYMCFDTSDDSHTVGDIDSSVAISWNSAVEWSHSMSSICVSKSGIIYAYHHYWTGAAYVEKLFYSEDSGSSWSEATMDISVGGTSYVRIIPAPPYACSTDDIWGLVEDSDDEKWYFLEYSKSGDTWTKTLIVASGSTFVGPTNGYHQGNIVIDPMNETAWVTCYVFDGGVHTQYVYEIEDNSTITKKFEYTGISGVVRWAYIHFDYDNGDRIYMWYATGGTSSNVYYDYTDDFGSTWAGTTSAGISDDMRHYSYSMWGLTGGGLAQSLHFDDDDLDVMVTDSAFTASQMDEPVHGTPFVAGGIYFTYEPGAEQKEDIFYTEIRSGGMLETGSDSVNALVNQLVGGAKQPPSSLPRHSLTPEFFTQAMQPFDVDLLIEAKDANEVFWHIGPTAGGNLTTDGWIYFADGTKQNIQYVESTSAQTISGAQYLYFIQGDEDLHVTSTWADAVGKDRGILALLVENTAGDGKCMILPVNGREPLISAVAITCDYLSAINADMGTLTAGRIELLRGGSSWTSWTNPNTAHGIVMGLDDTPGTNKEVGKIEGYDSGSLMFAVEFGGIAIFDEDMAFVSASYLDDIGGDFADGGGGEVDITSAAHGLAVGDTILIRNTVNYNGRYTIVGVPDANTISITATWVADDATGDLYEIEMQIDGDGALKTGNGGFWVGKIGLHLTRGSSAYPILFYDSTPTLCAQIGLDSSNDLLIDTNSADCDMTIDGNLLIQAVNTTLDGVITIDDFVQLEDESKTISGGTITVTKSRVRVDGEGAAADDLTNINGAADGRLLFVHCADAANDITVKNTGNIKLAGGADCVLGDLEDVLLLVYDLPSTSWLEVSRSQNS